MAEFKISAANPDPQKKQLTEYFKGRTIGGRPVSTHQATMMATFVRSLAAIKGGFKKYPGKD
jgi:hypothetical protein